MQVFLGRLRAVPSAADPRHPDLCAPAASTARYRDRYALRPPTSAALPKDLDLTFTAYWDRFSSARPYKRRWHRQQLRRAESRAKGTGVIKLCHSGR